MKPERWRQIDRVFNAAIERKPEERAAFLESACAGDATLRREVESLLASDEKAHTTAALPGAVAAEWVDSERGSHVVGQQIGRYLILSLIATGGMGEVYLARDDKLGRPVAIKLLSSRFTEDTERVRRFEQEARAASALNHPNILTIYEIGHSNDLEFIATEFVEGETVRERLRRAPFTLREAIDTAAQIAIALSAAHQAGIIHRDIKPENVMLRPDGFVKVLDFGLAKLTEEPDSANHTHLSKTEQVRTDTGVVMGTVSYMSPEQVRGFDLDARSDIFSLGSTLYEMATGKKAFQSKTTSDCVVAILEKEPAPLARFVENVPAEFERILRKALAKDRMERYQTVKDLHLDLKNLSREMELGMAWKVLFCPECAHENPLDFAFCSKCGASLKKICPGCGEEVRHDSHFCGLCGQSIITSQPEKISDTQALAIKATEEISPLSLTGAERRQATIVCSNLSGYAALAEQLDPEEFEKLTNRIRDSADEIMESYNGAVDHFSGEEIIALFGIPVSYEDDSLRAVRACLELHAMVREICADFESRAGRPVRLYTGISTGPVVTRQRNKRGQKSKKTGEAFQIAARLAAHADLDEILVSPETRRLVTPYFHTEAKEPFSLKPDGPPATSYRIAGGSGADTRLDAAELLGLTKYTGREKEMTLLHSALEKVLLGEGQFLTVAGDAGVGKSRLLLEFRHTLKQDHISVLLGRCQSYRGNIPYLPFIDALKDLLDLQEKESTAQLLERAVTNISAIDENLKQYLPLYLHLLSIQSNDHSLPHHLVGKELRLEVQEALSAIFTLKARRGPLIIFLEDWHWADEGSAEALKKLAGMLSAYPLMIVATYRPEISLEWGWVSSHTPLHLGPLEAGSAISIAGSVFGADELPDGLGEFLYNRTGGNPFFIEEVCRTLVEDEKVQVIDGWAILRGALEELHLPGTVQAVIRARLDRLAPKARKILRHASAIGREFSRRVLERTLDDKEQSAESLETLQRIGLIQQIRILPEAAYRFKHVLTQEVAYESLLLHQRKSLHEAIGCAIEQLYGDRLEEWFDVLTHHFSRAENWAKAARYGSQSANKADGLSHFVEALKLLEQVEEWLLKQPETRERKEELISILLRQERQCETLGFRDRQQSLIDRILSLLDPANDQTLLAEVYIRQGELFTLLGRFEEAEITLNKSLDIRQALGDRTGERKALRSLGFLYWNRNSYEDAISCSEAALAIDQAEDDAIGRAQDLTNMGAILRSSGNPKGALIYLEEALQTMQSLGRMSDLPHTLYIAANAYRDLGEMEKVAEYFQRALNIDLETHRRIEIAFMLNAMANLAWEQGETDKCIDLYNQIITLTRELNMRRDLTTTLNALGQRLAELGRYEEALTHLLEAAALFSKFGDEGNELKTLVAISYVYEHSPANYAETLATWDKIRHLQIRQGDRAGEIKALQEMARLTRKQAKDPEQALKYYEEALALAVGLNDAAKEGDLLNSMGIIEWERGNFGKALERYTKALKIFQESNNSVHAGLMLSSIGVTLNRMGRSDEAIERLEEAVQVHRECGQRLLEGHTLAALGDVLKERKSFDRALEEYQKSLALRQELGDRKGEGWMLHHIASLFLSKEEKTRANAFLIEALNIAEEIENEELKEACWRLSPA